MVGSRPTEEEFLGEELAVVASATPDAPAPEDDYPQGGDQNPPVPQPKPGQEKTHEEEDKPEEPKPDDAEPGEEELEAKPDEKPRKGDAGKALRHERYERRKLQERLDALLEVMQAQKQPQAEPQEEKPEIPDWEVNPMQAGKWAIERIKQIDENLNKTSAEQRQAQEYEASARIARETAQRDFAEASQENPELPNIYNAALGLVAKQVAFANRYNPRFGQADLQAEIQKIEDSHIQYALSNNLNVADYMMEFAASLGISSAPQPVADGAAGQPQQKSIAERQQQQRRHMSLSDSPGGGPPAKTTAKDVAKMSAKEFAEFAKRVGDKGLDEIMG